MSNLTYRELPSFAKEFKKIEKKFDTLSEDFAMAKKAAIELFHVRCINNQSTFEIPEYKGTEKIYKLRKFACQSLKGRGVKSGIRIIYAWNNKTMLVTFIEIYFKGNKENEDKGRIKEYLKSIENS